MRSAKTATVRCAVCRSPGSGTVTYTAAKLTRWGIKAVKLTTGRLWMEKSKPGKKNYGKTKCPHCGILFEKNALNQIYHSTQCGDNARFWRLQKYGKDTDYYKYRTARLKKINLILRAKKRAEGYCTRCLSRKRDCILEDGRLGLVCMECREVCAEGKRRRR